MAFEQSLILQYIFVIPIRTVIQAFLHEITQTTIYYGLLKI